MNEEKAKEKTKVTIWSSSHCAQKRKFPIYLQNLWSSQDKFESPVINATGGQRLTATLTSQIVDSIKSSENKPNVHVLILGDNDLRYGESVKTLIERFEQIIEQASSVSNCFVIICSLIHGRIFERCVKTEFFKLDRKLKILCQTKPRYARFVNLKQHLDKETSYASDCVHLNVSGTKNLAETVFQAIWHAPNLVTEEVLTSSV